MTKDLPVESGLEELPAYVATPGEKQLGDRIAAFLNGKCLASGGIQTFSTPRCLATRVTGLADAQTDLTEGFKGPSEEIVLDTGGNSTKAAQGFVRGKGLATDDIEFRGVKNEEYVYVTKYEAGKAAKEVLVDIPEILSAVASPVNMYWASNTFEYIRPIHTLTVLLDDEALGLDFLDIHLGHVNHGHRFLGHETEIANVDSYKEGLRRVFVIVDAKERQDMIANQIKDIEKAQDVQAEINSELLNEALNLVEYPVAFMGSSDTKYLEVPEEALVTLMRNHQRHFVVRGQAGKLMPNFISVRNGNTEHFESVIKGNERVLVARLKNGEFSWREDQKLEIAGLVARLDNIILHEEIGPLFEHMKHSKVIAARLTEKVGASTEKSKALVRTAEIYKFDLLTGMISEFDELQGVMGKKYTLLAGEDVAVATAIHGRYLPNSTDGDLSETKVGTLLILADELDTILSFFSVDLTPLGSNDPYALRRAAAGVVRIMDAFGLEIPTNELIDNLHVSSFDSLTYECKVGVMGSIRVYVKKMTSKSISKDIKEAVFAGSSLVVVETLEAAGVLAEVSKATDYKVAAESLPYIFNLTEKAPAGVAVNISLLGNDGEKALAQAVVELNSLGSASDKLAQLSALSPVINKFSDDTMVMVDNEAAKNNHLATLAELTAKASSIVTSNKLSTK